MRNNANPEQHSSQTTDAQLSSRSQVMMSSLVKKLPEDSPSMAWRSQLNEKIRAEAAKKAKAAKVRWFWSSSAGFGLATALAFVVLIPRGAGPVSPHDPSSSLESRLLSIHTESRALSSVSGTGVNYYETSQVTEGDLALPSDSDLGSL